MIYILKIRIKFNGINLSKYVLSTDWEEMDQYYNLFFFQIQD